MVLAAPPQPIPVRRPGVQVQARVKRRRDPLLDKVVDGDKKVQRVEKIKSLLCKMEGRVMSLKQLGLFRKQIGLDGGRRCTTLLAK